MTVDRKHRGLEECQHLLMTYPDPVEVLRDRPKWKAAVSRLRALISRLGDEARRRAGEYADCYAGRRGSMILDVALSRQRRYHARVLPLVANWERDSEEHSLRWLAAHEPDQRSYGLRSGEPVTTIALARNLAAFADQNGLGDDEDKACLRWAQEVAGLEHAPGLDPEIDRDPGRNLILPDLGPSMGSDDLIH